MGVPIAPRCSPLAGQTNYVQVRVRNRGGAEARNVVVRVYDAVGGTSMRWPDDWMPQVGEAAIPVLAAGASAVVSIPWRAVGAGHTCFLVRISADEDPVVSEGWVPFDNNLCQRNVQVVDSGTCDPSDCGTVQTGTRGRGHGYVTVTLRSPAAGIVTEKKAFQGMRFMPGEALYQVTDLSSVWVIADVFEQDIAVLVEEDDFAARSQLRSNLAVGKSGLAILDGDAPDVV